MKWLYLGRGAHSRVTAARGSAQLDLLEQSFSLVIYRGGRHVRRRLEARGQFNDVLEEARRLLAWHHAPRVSIRAGGRMVGKVLR